MYRESGKLLYFELLYRSFSVYMPEKVTEGSPMKAAPERARQKNRRKDDFKMIILKQNSLIKLYNHIFVPKRSNHNPSSSSLSDEERRLWGQLYPSERASARHFIP